MYGIQYSAAMGKKEKVMTKGIEDSDSCEDWFFSSEDEEEVLPLEQNFLKYFNQMSKERKKKFLKLMAGEDSNKFMKLIRGGGIEDVDPYVPPRRSKPDTRAEINAARGKLSSRIKDIINEVNQTNSARANNYLGGQMEQDVADDNGVLRHIRAAEGINLTDQAMRVHGGSCGVVAGNGFVGGPAVLLGKTGRKKRSDAGKPRKPSEWIQFVKLVQKQEGLSYKDAMAKASSLKKEGFTMADLMKNS